MEKITNYALDEKDVFLNEQMLLEKKIFYGDVTFGKQLSYYPFDITVNGETFENLISAHAPSRLIFQIDETINSFHTFVAINDNKNNKRYFYADFIVKVDGIIVSVQPHVRTHELREIHINIKGTKLELIIKSDTTFGLHTIWISPYLSTNKIEKITDGIERCIVEIPKQKERIKKCIVVFSTPGYEKQLSGMLASLKMNGKTDAQIVIFTNSDDLNPIIEKYNAIKVKVNIIAPLTCSARALMYVVPEIIDADYYLLLDTDILVLESIDSFFSSLEILPEDKILCGIDLNRNCDKTYGFTLKKAIDDLYSDTRDAFNILNIDPHLSNYSFIINEGVIAGSKYAILALNNYLRTMLPDSAKWIDTGVVYKGQFVVNASIAELNCAVEYDITYNYQLVSHPDIKYSIIDNKIKFFDKDENIIKILHGNGGTWMEYEKLFDYYIENYSIEKQ